MAKTKISEFSATPANNTDIDNINIAEGCAPSGINDAIRELMAQLKDFQAGTAGDSFNGPIGTTTAAAGAFTTLTASSTATLNTLASSGATLTGGTINGMAIGGTTAAAVSATTLTTSGAVTHNGGTANGVAYLNGSKVLTTGSALTFDGSTFGVKGSGQIAAIESTGNYSSSGAGFIRFKDSTGNRGYIGFGGTSNLMTVSNTVASAALNFELAGSEQMRLDSSGNLLLNTTSSRTGVNSISIEPSGNNYIEFRKSGSGSSTQIQFNRNTDTTPTSAGSIATTGTTTTYNTSSDYRLKDVTGALTGYKERLMSLQPKQGTWVVDGSEFRGFLAHEFANPYRASVTGEKDAIDETGNPIYQGMQASSSEVMADLVALVQEQQAIIESLKARLDAANL